MQRTGEAMARLTASRSRRKLDDDLAPESVGEQAQRVEAPVVQTPKPNAQRGGVGEVASSARGAPGRARCGRKSMRASDPAPVGHDLRPAACPRDGRLAGRGHRISRRSGPRGRDAVPPSPSGPPRAPGAPAGPLSFSQSFASRRFAAGVWCLCFGGWCREQAVINIPRTLLRGRRVVWARSGCGAGVPWCAPEPLVVAVGPEDGSDGRRAIWVPAWRGTVP